MVISSGRQESEGPPSAPSALSLGSDLWIHLGLIAAILFVYAQVWDFLLVNFDDTYYLMSSPHVANGLTLPGIKWAFTTFYFVNWHPLTWLSYMLDVEIYGLHLGGFHATNVALHAASSLLLFGLLRRLTGAKYPSAFVAALFAVHPLHVESVAWIAERKDVLSGVFLMLALTAYAAYARLPSRRRYLVVVAMFCLGLMSKPMLVTFPFVLLLLDFWPLRRWAVPGDAPGPGQMSAWSLVVEKVPLLLLAAVSCYVTVLAQTPAMAGMNYLPLGSRVARAANSYVGYAAKTLWPVRLEAFYPYPRVQSGWRMVQYVLGLFVVSLAVIRQARRRPYLPVGWFWYLGTLVPVIGLVQVGDQAMADRYTYIPIIGLFIIAAWGGAELASRRPGLRLSLWATAVAVVLACLFTARAQTGHWRDSKTLWTHALAVDPSNHAAEAGVASVLLNEGKVEESIAHMEKAVALNPSNPQLHGSLGVTLVKGGHAGRALPYLVKWVAFSPQLASAHSNLGLALVSLGRVDEGLDQLKEAVRLDPQSAEIRANLAIALVHRKRLDEAMSHFGDALRLDPDYADGHYNLAVTLFEKGNYAEAAGHLRTALRLRPDIEEARLMLADLERGPLRR